MDKEVTKTEVSIRIKADCAHDRWSFKKNQQVSAPAEIPLEEAELLVKRGNAELVSGSFAPAPAPAHNDAPPQGEAPAAE